MEAVAEDSGVSMLKEGEIKREGELRRISR
jgi:hypothetical protein